MNQPKVSEREFARRRAITQQPKSDYKHEHYSKAPYTSTFIDLDQNYRTYVSSSRSRVYTCLASHECPALLCATMHRQFLPKETTLSSILPEFRTLEGDALRTSARATSTYDGGTFRSTTRFHLLESTYNQDYRVRQCQSLFLQGISFSLKSLNDLSCRDFMVHLPARHNLRVLQNIQASGARFLMASTYVSADENKASETFVPIMGHNINLSLPPYCLPEPIALFEDNSSDRPDGRMGLWELNPSVPLTLSGDCSAISRSA